MRPCRPRTMSPVTTTTVIGLPLGFPCDQRDRPAHRHAVAQEGEIPNGWLRVHQKTIPKWLLLVTRVTLWSRVGAGGM